MAKDELARVLSEAVDAFNIRQRWDTVLENVYRLTVPDRFWGMNADRSPERLFNQVYDSTAVKAAQRLADRLVSGLIPAWVPWFALAPGPNIPAEERELVLDALVPATERVYTVLNMSNFGAEVQAMFLDLTVGTGIMRIQPAPADAASPVEFKAISLDGVALRHDSEGHISHLYRRFAMRGWQLASNPAFMRAVDDPDMVKRITENPQKLFAVLECNSPAGKRSDLAGFRYRNDYRLVLLKEAPESDWGAGSGLSTIPQDGWVLEEKLNQRRMPYIAPRWATVAGHPYGRGPGIANYGDIRTVNKLKEFGLNRVALNTLGAWSVVDDGVINPYNFNIAPGAVLPVARNLRDNPSIRALELPGDLDPTLIVLSELRRDIDNGYLANVLPSLGKTPKSATEILEHSQVVAQELGATYANLQNEFMIPAISATIDIMVSRGLLDSVHRLDRTNVDVVFLSQIALAQRMQDVNNILQFAAATMQFVQVDSRIAMLVDYERLFRRVAEYMNIPRDALRASEVVADMAEQMQQNLVGVSDASQQGAPAPDRRIP